MDNERGPTVLRDLRIKSVSVVDQGANQHAHIRMVKRAEEEPTPETQEEQVRDDAAFFARIGRAVAKALRLNREDKAADLVEKDARTFDAIDGAQKTDERICRIADALRESLFSIVRDNDMDAGQKAALIAQTADQAAEAIKADIGGMFASPIVKDAEHDSLDKAKEAPAPGARDDDPDDDPDDTAEDDDTLEDKDEKQAAREAARKGMSDMRFNMEAMTPEERAQLEDLQKRFGVEEEQPAEAPVTKAEDDAEDVYKGLNPAVKAELESLRKFRQEAEDRGILEVAKRYTLIGQKPEELAKTLKGLKSAGGTAYDDMIAVLDGAVQAVEQSGLFTEIGKRGTAANTDGAWEKIETAAAEIQKSRQGMSWADAIDQACAQHPELVDEYERGRR